MPPHGRYFNTFYKKTKQPSLSKSPTKSEIDKAFAACRPHIEKAVRHSRDRLIGMTADDLEQEVSLKILKLLQSGRQIDHLASYIRRVVATVVVDLARKSKVQQLEQPREEDDAGEFADETATTGLTDEATLKLIVDAVSRLPESQRVAVTLRLQGCTAREISQLTQWSTGKSESAVKRGMRALRQELQKLGLNYETE